MHDVNRRVKTRKAVYKAAHQFEAWDTALGKVRTYYHKQRTAATKKQRLETLNIGKSPTHFFLLALQWLLWCMHSVLASEHACHTGCFDERIQSIGAYQD